MYAKPHLNQRITRWLMLLSDLDLEFVQQKSIKDQTIADQLAEAPLPGEQFTNFNFPDELIATLSLREESYQMTLFFNGSKCQRGGGAGIVLIPLDAEPMPLSFRLDFRCNNNTAEYEALVLGLQVALHLGVKSINIFGDSQLVFNQVMGIYQCKNEELQKYKHYVDSLLTSFTCYSIQTIPRSTNKFMDTMACLASQIPAAPTDSDMFVLVQQIFAPSYSAPVVCMINTVSTNSQETWYHQFHNYLTTSVLPPDLSSNSKCSFLKSVSRYVVMGGLLYKRGFDGILLRCLTGAEVTYTIQQVHDGICGGHFSGLAVAKRILRLGYYWPTLNNDCYEYVKRCVMCQQHANLQHTPSHPLQVTRDLWPFSQWGLDLI
ncbi:hypothetical protein KI387_018361, partial [Taxus chinensis]